ncbi:MAG: hypothetical protein COA96_17210 [SAR86 cluster bacterium]|uniref:Sulfotransferase family protein n=1 Tax=SAR86 cluster bacterium TaxID=2030880 RepID=A0A2A5AFQ8_9GAMM|nr:MAG: hypothetical protein COA96_17210 [SAR86 cluster bacterium]
MIYVPSKNIIFVKSRKTASTSIEIALSFLARHDKKAVITTVDRKSEDFRSNYAVKPRNTIGRTNPFQDYYFSGGLIGARRILGDFKHRRKYWNHMPISLVRARLGKDVFDKATKISIDRDRMDTILSHINWKANQDDRILELKDYFCLFNPPDNDLLFTVKGKFSLDQVFYQERIKELYEWLESAFGERIPDQIKDFQSKAVIKKFTRYELEQYLADE